MVFLAAFVHAYEVPAGPRGRQPAMFLRTAAEAHFQHHGFGDEGPAPFDESVLTMLREQGLINVEYHERSQSIAPSARGQQVAAEWERLQETEAVADTNGVVQAVSDLAVCESPTAWPGVRPVFAALRHYWVEAGFPAEGIILRPLIDAVPETQRRLFISTVTALVEGDYLREAGALCYTDAPGGVVLTDRARAQLDGWPGSSPEDLVENLVAVLSEEARQEPNDSRRRNLQAALDAIRDLGITTASEIISRVMLGAS